MSDNRYLKSLNWFRAVAIIFVVLTHIPKNNLDEISGLALFSIFGNGTFFFVFISGYLFWHLKGKYDYIPYLKVKLNNVILLYVFAITPALIVVGLTNLYSGTQMEVDLLNIFDKQGVIWHLLVGGMSLNG